MDEVRAGIVPDTTATHRYGCVTNIADGATAKPQVDCLSAHVQAVPGHTLGVSAQHGVGLGGAVPAIDLEFAIRASSSFLKIVKEVEELGVDYGDLVGAVIPQKEIELSQCIALVVITDTVGYFDRFVCMEIVKGENASWCVVVFCGEDRSCGSGQGQSEEMASIHNPPFLHQHVEWEHQYNQRSRNLKRNIWEIYVKSKKIYLFHSGSDLPEL
jgi:hypothetical protein